MQEILQQFMDPEGSQQSATNPFYEQDETSPTLLVNFYTINFNIILPSMPTSFKVNSSLPANRFTKWFNIVASTAVAMQQTNK
jgi:hypothetical protein